MSTWATVATATALGATEGDAGGEAVGALVDGALLDGAPVEAVVETAGFAVVVTTVFGAGSPEPL
jgi:hypothetical protein